MMLDKSRPMNHQSPYGTAPPSHQTVKFLTAASIGAALTILSGLTLTATVVALIMVTPLLVLFSPILVPAGIITFLVTVGFVVSGGFGVAAVAALSWIYRYASGQHPPGADQLEYARMKIANKVKECGQYVQHMAHDATNDHHRQGYTC